MGFQGCAWGALQQEVGWNMGALRVLIRLAYPYSLPSASHEASMNRSADIWPNICTGYVYRVMGIAGRVPHAAPANQVGLTQLGLVGNLCIVCAPNKFFNVLSNIT